jgi:hypothetical protein
VIGSRCSAERGFFGCACGCGDGCADGLRHLVTIEPTPPEPPVTKTRSPGRSGPHSNSPRCAVISRAPSRRPRCARAARVLGRATPRRKRQARRTPRGSAEEPLIGAPHAIADLNRVAPGPADSTVPARSHPMTEGNESGMATAPERM